MSAFTRQLSAAQRQYDNAHDSEREADEARAEAVEARADKLYRQYAADDARVLEAVESVNTLGFDGLLDRAVRDFLLDWNAAADDDSTAIRDLAMRLHERIWPHVDKQLRDEATSEAEHEQARLEAEQAEVRGSQRRDAA